MLQRMQQLAVKVESVKGTRETTVGATDANLYAEQIGFVYNPEEVMQEPLRSSISTIKSVAGAPLATITCRVALKGSGTATTAPSWGKLLQCSGFKETINTASVVYSPVSADADSKTGTFHRYNDGVLEIAYGGRGTVTFEFNANGFVYANFTFSAIFYSRTDVAMLTGITYDSTDPEKWYDGSVSFNFGSAWTGVTLSTLNIDMANAVTLRPDANSANGLSYAIITNRDPGGSMDPDRVLVATQDWISHLQTPTTGSFSTTLGSTAGNTLTFAAPAMQIVTPEEGDREGVMTDQLSFKLRGSSGDDEFTITQS